jgi:uncharacterized ubiquitin-like protein YukD
MNETAIVEFCNLENGTTAELEVPLWITANDLIQGLNEAYELGMNIEDIFSCHLVAENPIAFLRGNKTLKEFGIRNGTSIIYRRD